MGNKIPVPDDRLQRMIDLLKLTKKDLGKLWKTFQKYDKDSSGTIEIDEFYKLIEEDRTVFGDSLFELVDIDSSGTLDFSEFVQTIGTYCLFGRQDILKFCFYVFDRDKNGYIDADELHALVEMLHNNNPTSNCRVALENFDKNSDGKVEFSEFEELNAGFPMLLFPAFRMQENMMNNTMGSPWWKKKKSMLQAERDEQRNAEERLKMKELQRQHRNQQRQVRHKMGFVQYYLCFFKRGKVLAQIAAEEAIRQEKREKKRQLKEKQQQQLKNRKDLENLFKDPDDAGEKNGGDDENGGGKKKKLKKKKKGEAAVKERKEELKKRKKAHKDRNAGDKESSKEERAARKAKRLNALEK